MNTSVKIIVLSTPLLHALLEDILKTLLPEGGYRVVDYVDFKSIASVYASLENEADGFLLAGGRVAKVAIQKSLQTETKKIQKQLKQKIPEEQNAQVAALENELKQKSAQLK